MIIMKRLFAMCLNHLLAIPVLLLGEERRETEFIAGSGCGIKVPWGRSDGIRFVDGPRPCQADLKPCRLVSYLIRKSKCLFIQK